MRSLSMQSYQDEEEKPLVSENIPDVPKKVDLSDMHANHKLLSDEDISRVKNLKLPPGRNKKKALKGQLGNSDISYDISVIDGTHYAIYKGRKKGKTLGAGAFGVVKLAQNLETGEWVALKVIKKPSHNDANENQMLGNQAVDLKIGMYKHTGNDNNEQTEILMKLAPGTTLNALANSTREVPTVKYMDIIIDMLEKAQKLHNANILHRDIKPGNIIFNIVDGQVTFVDFGLSRDMDTETKSYKSTGSGSGTVGFQSPEIRKRNDNVGVSYTEKSEVYALAVTIGKILGYQIDPETNRFTTDYYYELDDSFDGGSIQSKGWTLNDNIQKSALSVLNAMINKDPSKRPTVAEALQHFQTLRSAHLDAISKIMKIAYVDVNDYLAASKAERKAMMQTLSSVDQICLVDKNKTNINKYVSVKREFEEAAFNVQNKVVQYRHEDKRDLTKALDAHAKTQPDLETRVYVNYVVINKREALNKSVSDDLNKNNFMTVSPTKKSVQANQMKREMGLQINDNHLERIISLLEKEKSRLDNKMDKNDKSDIQYARQTRSDLIDNTIKELNKIKENQNNNIAYGVVYNKLAQLENDLQKHDRYIRIFGKQLHISSTKSRLKTESIMRTLNKSVDTEAKQEINKAHSSESLIFKKLANNNKNTAIETLQQNNKDQSTEQSAETPKVEVQKATEKQYVNDNDQSQENMPPSISSNTSHK